MSKDDIITEIANSEYHMTKNDITYVFESAINVIKKHVANGETIYLRGFGTFSPVVKKAKSVRNFKTLQNYVKESCVCPKFRPYNSFIKMVNDGCNKRQG